MVSVHSFSEVGGHSVNEDAFAVQQHPLDSDVWLCFVADGQGGQAGGGPAARLACETGLAIAVSYPPVRLCDRLLWPEIIRQSDKAVCEEPAAGFTTLVGMCISSSWVTGASNGDSAALLVSEGSAIELTSAQRKNPPVGSGAAAAVPFASILRPCWQILAMSDGVWKYARLDCVVESAHRNRGEGLAAELQKLARLPKSNQFQDDFTVVVLADTPEPPPAAGHS